MNAIVNVDKNWGIGKDGQLLFRLSQDMQYFRNTTTGGVVVMGRKTLESFPGQKPLKGRVNIVITRNYNYQREDVIVVHGYDELMEAIAPYPPEKVFLIGGGTIYADLLPLCEKAYVTKVEAQKPADTFFPNLDQNPDWEVEEESKDFSHEDILYHFVIYKKTAH